MRSVHFAFVGLFGFGLLPLLAGCESGSGNNKMATAPDKQAEGHVMGCQLCYDEVKTIRQEHAKGTQWSRSQVIREHKCPDCNAMVTTYTKDGVAMIKCQGCAPEGIACDKCMPPKK